MNRYFKLKEVGKKEWECIPHATAYQNIHTLLNNAYMTEMKPNHVILLLPSMHKAHCQVFLSREAATNYLVKTCMRYDAR